MPQSNFHNFQVDNVAMRYSNFAPRLFNFCLSLGMSPDCIMPSRAFCSDENQGYPMILLAKHFGIFPFDHGRVGGIMAPDRHGPHAHHGKDSVIIQASHVGYDPDTQSFGSYRRLQTQNQGMSSDCGAICGVLDWHQQEYSYACQQIFLDNDSGRPVVVIDNQLLMQDREEGLMLHVEKLVENTEVVRTYSTGKSFRASAQLIKDVGIHWPEKKTAIDKHLFPSSFYFRKEQDTQLASGLLTRNLLEIMPYILTSSAPPLSAAKVNAQVEFDRTFRTIVKEESYRGKKVVYISGIHIDISPREGQLFPLTKFVPWAAYIQNENGEGYTLEQEELFAALRKQSTENPYKIDLTEAIHLMEKEPEVMLHVDES